jgi:hypothetical protein
VLIEEDWRQTRRRRTWLLEYPRAGSPPRLLFDRSSQDRYSDPGQLATTIGPYGRPVPLLTPDGRSAYLVGDGASPEGDLPFLDRLDLESGALTRLWRCEAPFYEEVVAALDAQATRVITRRESPREVPNFHLRALASGQ